MRHELFHDWSDGTLDYTDLRLSDTEVSGTRISGDSAIRIEFADDGSVVSFETVTVKDLAIEFIKAQPFFR